MRKWALLALMFAPMGAWAQSVTVTWTNPTQNEDGTAIPSSGAGSLTGTIVEWGSCSGTAFGTKAGERFVTAPATTATVTGLSPGTWCFRAAARNTYGSQSAWSNVVSKVIPNPVPQPPTITTVAVVAGINMAPLYRINADGTRGSVVLGFVPVGTECSGSVVYRYRGREYRRLASYDAVQWWGSTPTTSAAAPCA